MAVFLWQKNVFFERIVMNYRALLLSFCSIALNANLVQLETFITFIIEQKQNSNYYKNYPTTIIKKASWLLGYGKISKDDLYLLDRLALSKADLRTLIQHYPVDDVLSRERFNQWQHKKRKEVIKELRAYTAVQCNCSVQDAYGVMRDSARIPDERYMSIVLQNLHDLCYFVNNIE
jgi:hypothetical protein